MKNFRDTLIPPSMAIRKAVEVIDRWGVQIALVADDDGRLLGTLTDGDVRRAILRGHDLDRTVETIMNRDPLIADAAESEDQTLMVMQSEGLRQVPVIDGERRIIGLRLMDELRGPSVQESPVVLMAGGVGARLRPLTDGTPKPMLKVGDKPLLETILENFVSHGCRRFFISVNYMAEKVEAHFGDGGKWGVSIDYLRESRELGTAGALSLLPADMEHPLILMNGDILTRVDFQQLLGFHRDHDAKLTMCIRDYHMQVPFGVVQLEDHRIAQIDEKPVHHFFVNAGIYVIEPSALALVPKETRFDMPQLVTAMTENGEEIVAFPLREYWLDVGRIDDFERANDDYPRHFDGKRPAIPG